MKKSRDKTAAGGQGTAYVNNLQAVLAAAESTIYENPARRQSGASLVVVNG